MYFTFYNKVTLNCFFFSGSSKFWGVLMGVTTPCARVTTALWPTPLRPDTTFPPWGSEGWLSYPGIVPSNNNSLTYWFKEKVGSVTTIPPSIQAFVVRQASVQALHVDLGGREGGALPGQLHAWIPGTLRGQRQPILSGNRSGGLQCFSYVSEILNYAIFDNVSKRWKIGELWAINGRAVMSLSY